MLRKMHSRLIAAVLFLAVVVLSGCSDFTNSGKHATQRYTSFIAFGGYIAIPGDYFVSLEYVSKGMVLLKPFIKNRRMHPEETMVYFLGEGTEADVRRNLENFFSKLKLTEVERSNYKGFEVLKLHNERSNNYDDSVIVETLTVVLKAGNYMAMFGDYRRGYENMYQDIIDSLSETGNHTAHKKHKAH